MCSLSPSGRAQRAQGAQGRCGERRTGRLAAKLRSVAPVASERVTGVPSLTVRTGGDLGGDAPAYLIVEWPSAASATSFAGPQNTPCSAPSTAVTQARHGGRNGRVTSVTQVFYNTCVTV